MPPKSAEREAVKVAVRLRPMSSNETASNFKHIIKIDQKQATVFIQNPQGQDLHFTFDFAFPDDIPQEEVYEQTAAPIVAQVLEGINGTIFAYGQTGTGKTYTMDGKSTGEHRGIVPRAFEHIFDYITANSESHQFMVTVTYVEIYNDELRDLLSTSHEQHLKIREDPQHGVQIKGVATHKVNCIDDLWTLLNFGKKNRKVRKTNMNAESSRSHSILTLCIETLTQVEGSQHVRQARLNLVDLAGSERVAKTGAEGIGFKEGVNINYELMILGNCIAALTSKGNSHIPYRDSKLTMLLRDSLGGNAKTMMIAAIGPADYNFSETMSTLRYAERAKKIENKPKVNMDPKDALLLKYQEELAALQAKLSNQGQADAQMGASESVIAAMEEKLAMQRQELAAASHMAAEEKAKLQKQYNDRLKEIEKEKQKREAYESRLKELNKYLVNGGHDLKKKTEENAQQIARIREKLKMREDRAKQLQKEFEEKRDKKQAVIEKCDSIQQKVEIISAEFEQHAGKYKNIKLKLPEVQRTIQEDRANMATNIDYLRQQIDLFTLIIDNYIPQNEVEYIRNNAKYDEEKNVWKRPEVDKKVLVKKVVSLERPKSAIGQLRPTAKSFKGSSVNRDDIPVIDLMPKPVIVKLKKDPVPLSIDNVEQMLDEAFDDTEHDFVVDVTGTSETTHVQIQKQ